MKKITDYLTYCIECDEPLINLGEFYLHPDNNCVEGDGCKILIHHQGNFKEFQDKHGKPKKRTHEIVEELIEDYNAVLVVAEKYDKSFDRRVLQWLVKVKGKVMDMKTRCIKNLGKFFQTSS